LVAWDTELEEEMGKYLVRIGDLDGMGKVYSEAGGLVPRSDETLLRRTKNADMDVLSPWRRILPGVLFSMLGHGVESDLYITTRRIVLIRKIDVYRSIKEYLTPFGLATAMEKEQHLKALQAMRARQYCLLWPRDFRLAKSKVSKSLATLYLVGVDGRKYAVTVWTSDKADTETIPLVASLFPPNLFKRLKDSFDGAEPRRGNDGDATYPTSLRPWGLGRGDRIPDRREALSSETNRGVTRHLAA
jgi:hypothetical protein